MSLSLKKKGTWLFVAGVVIMLIIAIAVGIKYFGS